MKIDPLSAKAKELMLEFGAEACVIIIVKADVTGDGWESESGSCVDTTHGLTWEIIQDVLVDASTVAVSTPVTPQDAPS